MREQIIEQFDDLLVKLSRVSFNFLSNAAAARLPVQQPKTQGMYDARGRYGVLLIPFLKYFTLNYHKLKRVTRHFYLT